MLGNFSFGDYFKKETIAWAWEFLTRGLGIDPAKLWVSIYKDDIEAEKIWKHDIGLSDERIFRLGDKSNFWPANAKTKGPNGPCGPCSEIFFDYHPDDPTVPKDPDDIPGRFSEVWNLVFTQFERQEGGKLVPLPNQNIDTGMGLERLAAVLQGKANNFETDLFVPILQAIDTHVGNKLPLKAKRIIADHIRAITFAINDGVVPSNEGRGYVIKKLIIITSDIAQRNGQTHPCIHRLIPAVCDAMGETYPDINRSSKVIADTIKNIEEAYIKVRSERLPQFEKKLADLKALSPTGADYISEVAQLLFTFRDTYGLTVDTMRTPVMDTFTEWEERDFETATERYNALMEEQQERSRASSNISNDVFKNNEMELNVPKTQFIGYDRVQSIGTILALYVNNEKTTEAGTGTEVKIVLDKTPFYAESGGQIGDTGELIAKEGLIEVTDTQKISDVFIHIGMVKNGSIHINDQVTADVNLERRLAIMRNHTSTHLLQTALREILGAHVQQQGSYVSDERLRFDFTHPKAVSDKDLQRIEKRVNELILLCDTVTKEYLSQKQAKERGALAFFEEKYGEVVRVVSIGDYSQEFCGGTHLDSTGQIGVFKILSESAIAQGIRRIEAKTGLSALDYTIENENRLKAVARRLKAPVEEIEQRVKAQKDKIKTLEKELGTYKFASIKNSIESIIAASEKINGSFLVSHCFSEVDTGTLRKINDLIKQKTQSAVIILGTTYSGNATLTVSVSDDLIDKGFKANEIIQDIAPVIEGSGGGRPQFAQAGSKNTNKIGEATKKAIETLKGTFVK
jgi:alanyl-tRNA synthetase